jgi:membrane protease YdiL (CAAX protease family)
MQRSGLRPSSYGWRFIDLAGLGINTARSYITAAALIILFPLLSAVLLGLVVGIGAAVRHDPTDAITPIAAMIEQYGPIVIAGLAVLHCTAAIHRRPWQSLIAPNLRIDWRRVAIGLGAELAILSGQLGLVHALIDLPWTFSVTAALPILAVGLLLVPLQAASEELLFRGYLTQALGQLVRSRIAIAVAVGIVFGSLHLNTYGPLTVLYFLVVSLIFSLVSLRDDRLELAIGGHAAMNLFAFTMANSLSIGPGLIGAAPTAMPFNWAAILVVIVNGALFYGLTRLLVGLICEGQPMR